jgi:hypothetical protein
MTSCVTGRQLANAGPADDEGCYDASSSSSAPRTSRPRGVICNQFGPPEMLMQISTSPFSASGFATGRSFSCVKPIAALSSCMTTRSRSARSFGIRRCASVNTTTRFSRPWVSVRAPHFGTRFGTHSPTTRRGDNSRQWSLAAIGAHLQPLRVERTGIEPVTSDLQIPGFSVELGQVGSVNAMLCRLRAIEIGYSGTRFGTRFVCDPNPVRSWRVPVVVKGSCAGSIPAPSMLVKGGKPWVTPLQDPPSPCSGGLRLRHDRRLDRD